MIYLIGVAHQFQLRPFVDWKDGGPIVDISWVDRFESYLRKSAARIRPEAICEEYSETQMANTSGGAVSVARTVATDRNVKHVFCDPNADERAVLYAQHGTTEELDKLNGWPVREKFWLSKIEFLLPAKRTLFICGADHVPTFRPRLQSRDIMVKVLHTDLAVEWGYDGSAA